MSGTMLKVESQLAQECCVSIVQQLPDTTNYEFRIATALTGHESEENYNTKENKQERAREEIICVKMVSLMTML